MSRSSNLRESFPERYHDACQLAVDTSSRQTADYRQAAKQLQTLHGETADHQWRSRLENDLAVLQAAGGQVQQALTSLDQVISRDPTLTIAQRNRSFLSARLQEKLPAVRQRNGDPPRRIAVISLLFNWPSTGGGNIHTYECAAFLADRGHQVHHFYAVHSPLGIGDVRRAMRVAHTPIPLSSWHDEEVRERFREALHAFQPDEVIITDSWSTKPLLAEAAAGFRYWIRLAAQECVCPLNNVRLLSRDGHVVQCNQNQLAQPDFCHRCVDEYETSSGPLHRFERDLAGYERADYAERLRSAFANAAGVLAVYADLAERVRPFCRRVEVVPSGFDRQRFPDPPRPPRHESGQPRRILFAGLAEEWMKGFDVLRQAVGRLRQRRSDVELWVTSDPLADWPQTSAELANDDVNVRYLGWQSQAALPQIISETELLVFPTLAQEALGRSIVEAMACGRAVIASRLGGLPEVIDDGETGLLVEPGDPDELAAAIERLLEDPSLADAMGQRGREKFEREYTWEAIYEKHYRRLFAPRRDAVKSC